MAAFPVADPLLDARLRDVSARFFTALKGASFGRCDLRVDRDGTPYMLEMNANCGVYYPAADAGSADLCLANDPAGHEGFTRQLVNAALRRHERRLVPEASARISAG
jgi:D-alanine-D-alanine ligase